MNAGSEYTYVIVDTNKGTTAYDTTKPTTTNRKYRIGGKSGDDDLIFINGAGYIVSK